MKNTFRSALLFTLLPVASLFSQGLSYHWKPGMIQKFRAVQNDKINMGGGMMGMVAMAGDMEFRTETDFALRIDQVLPNGSAKGSFYVTNFSVKDTKGNQLASLRNLPKSAIEADFTVDRKGNFTFTEIPILLSRDNTTLLVSSKIEKGEMAASAEADGEKVTLFAEFNPKTGALKAGYNVATVGKPKSKAVVVKEDDETIDLLPTDFLDLLVLPEGMVAEGQVMKTKMYDTEITEKVEDFTNDVATLKYLINSSLDARKFEKDAKKMAGDEDDTDEAKDDGDGDMAAMGFGGAGGGTPQMGQEMTGDIKLIFDNGQGMIREMSGVINTKMNMMGMEMSTKSTVKMTPVP
jgi:hypothetical protein